MQNQCKSTTLLQIKCIHHRNFAEKKRKQNYFSFEKYQKSAPSIIIVVISLKKVPLSSLLFLQSICIDICRYDRYF